MKKLRNTYVVQYQEKRKNIYDVNLICNKYSRHSYILFIYFRGLSF